MGDRVSVSFKKDNEESVALFSHWGGRGFLNDALKYAKHLCDRSKDKSCSPLDRKEPNTAMVDFIRVITKGMEEVDSDLYLGKDESEGDNSDRHFIIDLDDASIL